MRCRSLTWRIRTGAAPGGSTGTVADAQGEPVALDEPGVGDARDSGSGDGGEGADHGPGRRRHRTSIPVDAGCETGAMTDSSLKSTLRSDLHDAIRSQDKVRSGTLRMTLTAITNAEVAGDRGQGARPTTRSSRSSPRRRRSARRRQRHTSEPAGRSSPQTEDAELAVLEAYLPQQLGDDELERIVRAAVASSGATAMAQMGQVMKAAQGEIAGRADGGRVAAIVKQVLAG